VITSHKKNVEIDWTWQELEEKEDCEELAKVKLRIITFIGYRSSKGRMQGNHRQERHSHSFVHGAIEDERRGICESFEEVKR
jgi:hypothetical protein